LQLLCFFTNLQNVLFLNRGTRRGFFTTTPTYFPPSLGPKAFFLFQCFFISLRDVLPLVIQAASSATLACAFSGLPAAVRHRHVVIAVFSKPCSTLTARHCHPRGPLQLCVCAYMCMFCHVSVFWRETSVVLTT